MMANSDITKEFKEKLKKLKKHNDLYYNQDKPSVSDAEYDNLKKEIFYLENKYDFLKKLKLHDKIVGSPTNKFNKIKHLSPMLSLSNAFHKNDMQDFNKKIKNFLNLNKKLSNYFQNQK